MASKATSRVLMNGTKLTSTIRSPTLNLDVITSIVLTIPDLVDVPVSKRPLVRP